MAVLKNKAIEQCVLGDNDLVDRGFRLISGTSYMYMNQEGLIYSSLKNNIVEPNRDGKISYYNDLSNRTKENISSVRFKKAHMNTFPEFYGKAAEWKGRIFDNYLVNEDGSFYSLSTGDEMTFKLPSGKYEYPKIGLRKDGKKTTLRVHQIIADIFVVKPKDFNYKDFEINHIDGNKHNYSIENLEWISKKENMQHAYDTGLYDDSLHEYNIFDNDMNYIDSLIGSRRVMEYIGYNNEQITRRVALHNLKAISKEDLRELNNFYIIYKNRSPLIQ